MLHRDSSWYEHALTHGRTMTEIHGSTLLAGTTLTPRQDRLEQAIVQVLRAGGTRSILRDHVLQLGDHLRMQGVSVDRATSLVRALGNRATPFMALDPNPAVGDSPADRIAMMVRWCTARYSRAD